MFKIITRSSEARVATFSNILLWNCSEKTAEQDSFNATAKNELRPFLTGHVAFVESKEVNYKERN